MSKHLMKFIRRFFGCSLFKRTKISDTSKEFNGEEIRKDPTFSSFWSNILDNDVDFKSEKKLATLATEEAIEDIEDVSCLNEQVICSKNNHSILEQLEEKLEENVLSPKYTLNDITFFENGKFKHGGCSKVRQGILNTKSGPCIVAVKKYKIEPNDYTEVEKNFKNEVSILKSINHDNIIKYIGVIDQDLTLLTEWCSGPNLLEYLNSSCEECFYKSSMYELMDLAVQIAVPMEYLHANKIIHRDLKSQNVFLILKNSNSETREWNVKLGDFGLAISAFSKNLNLKNLRSRCIGSSYWMPPEVLNKDESNPYTEMSDVYSFGIILYELVTGELPFKDSSPYTVILKVGKKAIKIESVPASLDTSQKTIDLLKECIDYKRENRPMFSEILKRLEKIKQDSSKIAGRKFKKKGENI